ncbi:NEO1 protein, partial [Aegithalos caudatus]|nr:NEO1 protein [Aegithalos caudatus]
FPNFPLNIPKFSHFFFPQSVDVEGRSYRLEGLEKFREFGLRLVAYNRHGAGPSSQQVVVRTLSD